MSRNVVVLEEAVLRARVTISREAMAVVEAAFAALGRGGVVMPPVLHLDLPERHAEMDLLQNDPLSLGVWKPIIGAINGYCLAGGWYLAQMCDVRIAETHALFGIPETRWAQPASFTWMLPRSVPLRRLSFCG